MSPSSLHPPADPGHVIDELHAWLPEWLELTLAQKRENDQWFVLIEEYDITGTGETQEAARAQALDLLQAYLLDHFHDGTPFDETRRPIPARLKLSVRLGTATHLLAGVFGGPGAKEYKVLVSPSGFNEAIA
jgi:hypothetical protein